MANHLGKAAELGREGRRGGLTRVVAGVKGEGQPEGQARGLRERVWERGCGREGVGERVCGGEEGMREGWWGGCACLTQHDGMHMHAHAYVHVHTYGSPSTIATNAMSLLGLAGEGIHSSSILTPARAGKGM